MLKKFLYLFPLLLVTSYFLLNPSPTFAFSNLVNYQGRAFDSNNKYVPNGCYPISFDIQPFNSVVNYSTTTPTNQTATPLSSSLTYDTSAAPKANYPSSTSITPCPTGQFYVENGLFNALLDVSSKLNSTSPFWGIRVSFNGSNNWSKWQPFSASGMSVIANNLSGSTGGPNVLGGILAYGNISTGFNTGGFYGDFMYVNRPTPLRIWSTGVNNGAPVDIISEGNGGAANLIFDITNWSGNFKWRFGHSDGRGGQYQNEVMNLEQNGNLSLGGNLRLNNENLIMAKDTNGTAQSVLYGRWNDNATYLDGGTGGTYLRTNNNSTTNVYLPTSGGVQLMSNSNKLKFGSDPTGEYIYSERSGSYPIVFTTAWTDRLKIQNNGDIVAQSNAKICSGGNCDTEVTGAVGASAIDTNSLTFTDLDCPNNKIVTGISIGTLEQGGNKNSGAIVKIKLRCR